MQLVLHPTLQRQSTGFSEPYTEPDFKIQNILVRITAISVDALGSVTFRLQHSADGSDWSDIPNTTTENLSTTGTTILTVDPGSACFDNLRFAWTFDNANSVTFYGAALGTK